MSAARESLAAAALTEARAWIETPYLHRGSARQHGADCLGLVRGVWRAVIGPEPAALADYGPAWDLGAAGGAEPLRDAFDRWLIAVDDPLPGEVGLWRMRDGGPATHCGIMAPDPGGGARLWLIHAWSDRAVALTPTHKGWDRRRAGFYRWPTPAERG